MPAGRRRAATAAAIVVLALLLLGLAGSMLLGGGAPGSGPATETTPPPAADAPPAVAAPPAEAPADDAPADSAPAPASPHPGRGTPASDGKASAPARSKTEAVRDQFVAARIVDATTGRPIAGASVRVGMLPLNDPKFEATTDAQGRFRVDGLPRGSSVRVVVEAPGYVSEGEFLHPTDSWEFEMTISPASRLFGRVLDPEGKPVAGAKVFIDGFDGRSWFDRTAQDHFEWARRIQAAEISRTGFEEVALVDETAVTDASGRFEAEGIPVAQALDLMASANGFSPSEVRRGLVIPSGSAGEEVTLTLRPDTTLVLRVEVLPGTDRPATVRATAATPIGPRLLEQREDGSLVVSGLFAGKTWYVVEAPPYAAVFETVDVEPGSTLEVPVRLGTGNEIAGRVVDAEGRGAPGLRVEVARVRKGAAELVLGNHAVTDAGGDFLVRGLEDGDYALATADAATRYRMEHGTFRAPASGLRLPAPGSLRFRLVMPAGKALPEKSAIEVRHAPEKARYLEFVSSHRNLEYDAETGRVRLPKTFPGPMTLSLKVAGCQALRRQIEIPAGGEVDYGDIALAASFRTTGRVTDGEGNPVEGAQVEAWYPSRDRCQARTGPDGTFELLDLAPGPVTIEAHDAANDPEKFALRTWKWNFFADMAPLELQMTPGGAVRVRVLDAAGVPVTVSHVVCEPEGGKAYRAVPRALIATGEPGEYAGRRQPGPMLVQALDPLRPYASGALASAKVTIRDGAETFVEIRLTK